MELRNSLPILDDRNLVVQQGLLLKDVRDTPDESLLLARQHSIREAQIEDSIGEVQMKV